jgi:serine/threonine-protein kinase
MTPHYCSKGHENSPGGRFCIQCGEQLEPPVSQVVYPGEILGDRYRIVRELGHGGFGRTYLAEDLNRFNEPCVLKEFAPQVQGTYALQKAEELFEREAGVLYKLQHPQIPKFRELFRVKQGNKGRLFLVQDFVEGQTYHALLDARRRQGLRFNETEATQLMLQILPVLEYIHSLGVIHRDISTDNLIWRSTDRLPVLIDFGGVKQVAATVASQFIASQGAGGMPAMATRLGKVGYAPHEQMQGGIVFPHSDLYALAVTVLVLLTGKEPQQLIDPHTLAWNWRREVNLSPRLGSVLDKMLQPRPSDRFASAVQVLQALTAAPPPVAYPPTQPPLPRTEATVAVAPPPVTAPVNPPTPPVVRTPLPSSTGNQSSGWLRKSLLMFILIAVAGGIGWLAGNLWIQSQRKSGDIQPQPTDNPTVVSPTNDSEPKPPPEFSAQERQRKETLRQRRINLGIDYNFYTNLVNEAFWNQYPDQRGRQLGTSPDDASLREQWDAIAADLLDKVDRANLSVASRQQLGSYKDADLTRAKAEANQLRLSSRSLYDLADAKFFLAFPQEQGKEFLNKPIGQVWQAIVADTLNAVKTGEAFERIAFDPGQTSKKITGSLKAGAGKAFIASLSAGQVMNVTLTTDQRALFSIYSPSGKTTLLEDSGDRTWSGSLPESGFYEFVVVSNASRPIDYQLDLTVETLPTPEPSPVESGG